MSQTILSDENCAGQARVFLNAIKRINLADLIEIKLQTLDEIEELRLGATDAAIWHYCQAHSIILLTDNRSKSNGDASLEAVAQQNWQPDILPVLTIGRSNRIMHDSAYCERCAENLAEVFLDLDRVKGTIRLYLSKQ